MEEKDKTQENESQHGKTQESKPQNTLPINNPKSPVSEDAIAEKKIGEKELKNLFKDKNFSTTFSEFLRGKEAAMIYIDARSGGVFFQEDAKISGDVVGQNQQKNTRTLSDKSTKDTQSVSQIIETDLRKIYTVYVKSSTHAKAISILQRNNLLILHGRAHTGKWTAAVKMLSELHQLKIIELDPTVNPNSYHFQEKRTGYLVDSLSANSTKSLTLFQLNSLSRQLKNKESHLVIVIDERMPLATENLKHYLVKWEPPTNEEKVLLTHLKWYAPEIKEKVSKQLLLDESIQSLLKVKHLPREIDRLAELLSDVLKKKNDLDVALSRFSALTREEIQQRFEELKETDDLILLLSVAVFNGASYQNVSNAQKRLQNLFPEEEKEKSSISMFSSSRTQRVTRIGAQIKQGFETNELGRVPVEVVEFDNPAIQPAVLEYAWREYDLLRDILVEWLLDSAHENIFDIRARAATAVGELSKYDFSYITHQIISTWANHASQRVRFAGALALGIPAWDRENAPFVLKLLHHWATLDNNWRLTWTAGAAYGGLVGLRFIDAALRDLHYLAKSGDLRLLNILATSMSNLFEAGEVAPEYRYKVLESLLDWTKDKKADGISYLAGLFVFLFLIENIKQKPIQESDEQFSLLWMVDDKILGASIIELWKRSLSFKATRRYALELLQEWFKETDEDIRLFPKLKTLVEAIRNSTEKNAERDKERINYYINLWAESPFELETASKLNLSTQE